MKRLLWPWRVVPSDARWVVLVALAMPFLLHLYHLTSDQRLARIIFSSSCALGALLVGHLIARGGRPRPDAMPDRDWRWRAYKGHVVGAVGLTAALMAILALDSPWLDTGDRTMTWRLLTGMAQGAMAAGWIVLWQVRRAWLSHGAAGIAAAASIAGFALYVVANFLLEDTATMAWGWGVIHPRSILARAAGMPWIEPLIATMMLLALTALLRRWWLRAQDSGVPSGS